MKAGCPSCRRSKPTLDLVDWACKQVDGCNVYMGRMDPDEDYRPGFLAYEVRPCTPFAKTCAPLTALLHPLQFINSKVPLAFGLLTCYHLVLSHSLSLYSPLLNQEMGVAPLFKMYPAGVKKLREMGENEALMSQLKYVVTQTLAARGLDEKNILKEYDMAQNTTGTTNTAPTGGNEATSGTLDALPFEEESHQDAYRDLDHGARIVKLQDIKGVGVGWNDHFSGTLGEAIIGFMHQNATNKFDKQV